MYNAKDPLATPLADLMAQNYEAGKPLLEGAYVYRGTKGPNQTSGKYSEEFTHGTILVRDAAAYTQADSSGKHGFIGAYPLDREKTRFYEDFGIEQAMKGRQVTSYTVGQVESELRPFVEAIAKAPTADERRFASIRLENQIHRRFYEVAVPTRDPHNPEQPNRPDVLYAYKNTSQAHTWKDVSSRSEVIGSHNQHLVKEAVYDNQRSAVNSRLAGLEHTLSGDGMKAVRNLKEVIQTEFGRELRQNFDRLPVNEFLDAVNKHPRASAKQIALGEIAVQLAKDLQSPNFATECNAHAVAKQLANIDPRGMGFSDIAKLDGVKDMMRDRDRDREPLLAATEPVAKSAPQASAQTSPATKPNTPKYEGGIDFSR